MTKTITDAAIITTTADITIAKPEGKWDGEDELVSIMEHLSSMTTRH